MPGDALALGTRVLGTFAAPGDAARAVGALREAGFDDVTAAMPAPYPELVAALARPRSPIALVALPGAAVGLACGAALTVATSLAWPLVTGGKPIVSVPPFAIIGFELAVLVGALANLAALSLGAVRGARRQTFPRAAIFTGDRVGVLASGGATAVAARILRESGAEEVALVP